MGRLSAAAIDFWRRRRLTTARYRCVEFVESVAAIDELPRRSVTVVGEPGHLKWAVFACPCGTGHRIQVPLRASGWPRWKLTISPQGAPSLTPSVDDRRHIRCHFWLRDGRVKWVKSHQATEEDA
jgi:hypothetical protein